MTQKLPISIQSFSKLREGNYLYVDKTKILHQLTAQEGAYFLSRPRRFGKSMLISTLHALYEGRKELFEGLYIYDQWNWDKTYPVIRIDFAEGVIESREQLDAHLFALFAAYQQHFDIICEAKSIVACFRELIIKLHDKYRQRVVILIDEYDKPILDNILNIDVASSVREGLKNFYSVMKAQDAHIQFIFMTGVTKFSKVSLFSGINQIVDITLNSDYATICGYTHQDLETLFADHLVGVDMNKLKDWYNGYNFLGEPVYNPYDILLFIHNHHSYLSYWFGTGSPSFLLKLFKQEQYFLPDLEDIEVGEEILESFDVEHINPITLLFQSGYLTIKGSYINFDESTIFCLTLPNHEVRLALHKHLLAAYTLNFAGSSKSIGFAQVAHKALAQKDLALLQKTIISLFAGIPWRNFNQNDIDQFEGYYASVLYAFFASINAVVIPEDISNHGQADLTVIMGDYIYIMEIKRDTSQIYDTTKPNPALQQIIDNQYAQKYLAQQAAGKTIIQLGLVFNIHARNLVAFAGEVVH